VLLLRCRPRTSRRRVELQHAKYALTRERCSRLRTSPRTLVRAAARRGCWAAPAAGNAAGCRRRSGEKRLQKRLLLPPSPPRLHCSLPEKKKIKCARSDSSKRCTRAAPWRAAGQRLPTPRFCALLPDSFRVRNRFREHLSSCLARVTLRLSRVPPLAYVNSSCRQENKAKANPTQAAAKKEKVCVLRVGALRPQSPSAG